MARSFASLVGAQTPFDPSAKLVSSPFMSPLILACLRLFFGFYLFVALLTMLIYRAVVTHNADQYFSYFTMLTGIGLCSYLLHAGLQTFIYARRLRQSSDAMYPLQSWPRTLQVLHMMLLATVRTFPFLVTIVFWTFLADNSTLGTAYGRYTNISVHAFNSVFALFEIIFTNTPMSAWFNTIFMVIILGCYVGVAYITYDTQHFYVYSFLDPSEGTGKLAAYIVGIPVGELIIFSIVNGLLWLRIRFTRNKTAAATTGIASEPKKISDEES